MESETSVDCSAVSVPCGFDLGKLPIGIQFVGCALEDQKVIAAARLFQQYTDWHRKRPPVEKALSCLGGHSNCNLSSS
jgi:Asp-tRNA(Asn)/Glu-tRNA(Gln) amidotransferase A subunit family amidase